MQKQVSTLLIGILFFTSTENLFSAKAGRLAKVATLSALTAGGLWAYKVVDHDQKLANYNEQLARTAIEKAKQAIQLGFLCFDAGWYAAARGKSTQIEKNETIAGYASHQGCRKCFYAAVNQVAQLRSKNAVLSPLEKAQTFQSVPMLQLPEYTALHLAVIDWKTCFKKANASFLIRHLCTIDYEEERLEKRIEFKERTTHLVDQGFDAGWQLSRKLWNGSYKEEVYPLKEAEKIKDFLNTTRPNDLSKLELQQFNGAFQMGFRASHYYLASGTSSDYPKYRALEMVCSEILQEPASLEKARLQELRTCRQHKLDALQYQFETRYAPLFAPVD